MKLRSRFLWLLLVVDALAFAVLASADEKVHVIQKGDTIYSLARSYGVKPQDILDLNGIKDPDRVLLGQKVRIPGPATTISATSKRQTLVDHLVAKGETLTSIARQYGISLKTLCSANNLSETYKVKAGERLRVPQIGPAVAVLPPSLKEELGTSAPPAAQNPAVILPRSTVNRTLDQSVPWPILAREMAYMTGKLNGVVLIGERNEPVKSLKEGVVISAGPYRGFGKVAIIQVTGGYLYVYGGCESLSVQEGDRVNQGTELGRLGMDALSEKPQLFFMVYRNSVSMDPALAPRT
ncbi:peptidoglycan-binding protein LysM [Spirochaetia bacterium]|nr:peptidoglycan-binding protein LysM [Spirochaetia bacterium]